MKYLVHSPRKNSTDWIVADRSGLCIAFCPDEFNAHLVAKALNAFKGEVRPQDKEEKDE